jgi:hypothetical protein
MGRGGMYVEGILCGYIMGVIIWNTIVWEGGYHGGYIIMLRAVYSY